MKLFFATYTDGENFDLFVIADTVEQVAELWGDYYGMEGVAPDMIYHVAAACPVGFHEKPHALEWHGVNLPRVGGSFPADPRYAR